MQTKLSTRLGQRLALTPRLAQSLKVLSMSSVELDAYVEECLQTNPLLETDTPVPEKTDVACQDKTDSEPDNLWRESGDDRWERMYVSSTGQDYQFDDDRLPSEQCLSHRLHEQVDCEPMSSFRRQIAHAIVDSLDEDGYFRSNEAEIAEQIQVEASDVSSVLEGVIHQLEPGGIGSRCLEECLLLQLDGTSEADILARHLLKSYADHLGDGDETLAELTGSSLKAVKAARARMRRLDPYPGHSRFDSTNIYARPEIIFHRDANGSFRIEVPSYTWQKVSLSARFQGQIWKGAENDFVHNAEREARWLIDALEQRKVTLHKVANCLMSRQGAFLKYGPLGLKPLTLLDVATEVGLHESTISRVTSGKYAQTPLGLIEMKQFFSSGLPTRGGGVISVFRVKRRIKALIDSEPKSRPISDQAISNSLQAEGIRIARRTVAKYREQLHFPASGQRKEPVQA